MWRRGSDKKKSVPEASGEPEEKRRKRRGGAGKFAGLCHWGAWHEKGKTDVTDPVVKTSDTIAGGFHITRLRDELMD